MFGLGPGELIFIFAIALILLGPKRLPDVATSLGKAIRQFRKATQELTDQLEVDEQVKQPLRELKAALRDDPVPHTLVAPSATTATPAAAAAVAPVAAMAPTAAVAPVAAAAPTKDKA